MKTLVICTVLLLVNAGLAYAGQARDESSYVTCFNAPKDAIAIRCNIQRTDDGSAKGSCYITTYKDGRTDLFTNWVLNAFVKPTGGSHPDANKREALTYSYPPGGFSCSINPPPQFAYTVGKCTQSGDLKTCIVGKQIEGMNAYYTATAQAGRLKN